MKKKILIYINSMLPAGGIERVVANLANVWSSKYSVTILVKDKGESFYWLNDDIIVESLNVPLSLNMKRRVSRVWSLFQNMINTRSKLQRYLSSYEFDYIYVTSPFNALEISLLGKKGLRKLIISEHGSKFAYNRFYKIIKKIIYPRVYKVSVPTTMDTELYIREKCNAVYIPHLSTFSATRQNKLDSKLVLNVGRLTSDKQQLLLLQIWKEMKFEGAIEGWRLIVVGKGEEESQLLNYIIANGLQDSVTICSPTHDVEKYYQQASIFAFTSKFEGFGMVLLEAMAFGIPCVSFDCPSGPRDIIEDGKNGLLIRNNDKSLYKEALQKLINNEQYLKTLGNGAFSTVRNWDNQKISKQWEELFKGVNS